MMFAKKENDCLFYMGTVCENWALWRVPLDSEEPLGK